MPATRTDLTDAIWHKSSYSNPSGGDCLEVASNVRGLAPVRDSKAPGGGPVLLFPVAAWTAFVQDVTSAAIPRPGRPGD